MKKASDLISREVAIEKLAYLSMCYFGVEALNDGVEMLENLPAVDAEPVRHGRWVMSTEVDESWYNTRMVMRCTECNFPVHVKSGKLHMNYCPNCGAHMDGGER